MKNIPFYIALCVAFAVCSLRGLGQGIGRYIVNVDFGQGSQIPGPSLRGLTPYHFSPDTCPPPGSYTVTNNLYLCPLTRMGRSIDNTPESAAGYMMAVNDTPSRQSRVLFIDTVNESLCPDIQYQFSAYFLNTTVPPLCSTSNIRMPSFTFKVQTLSGLLLKTGNTGNLGFDYAPPPAFTPKFHPYAVSFFPPMSGEPVVLVIEDDPSGYTPCGYSFAIDDITLTSLGPSVNIQFTDALGQEIARSACFTDDKLIPFTGTVPAGYADPAYQWQRSSDSGRTWTDIANADSVVFNRNFGVQGHYLVRMSAAERTKIANPNCRVVSNALKVNIEGPPTDYTITSNSPACFGGILQFNATGGASYEWSGPNGFSDNVYYAHVANVKFADSGTYFVRIISAGGCSALDSIHVAVIGTDVASTVFPADTAICKGTSIRLR
ncbi:MAG TPA: hypothetical protein VGC95_01115, partial [Chitinophagaceae bacterium]